MNCLMMGSHHLLCYFTLTLTPGDCRADQSISLVYRFTVGTGETQQGERIFPKWYGERSREVGPDQVIAPAAEVEPGLPPGGLRPAYAADLPLTRGPSPLDAQ